MDDVNCIKKRDTFGTLTPIKQKKMNTKIDLFDEVKITDNCKNSELIGKIGVVIGVSEEDGIVYGYSVRSSDLPHSYSFSVYEVNPTGKRFKREEFYDGTSLSVSKDGELL